MTLDNLKDLYVEQLRDIYNAEQQLVEALPKVVNNASHSELKEAFQEHLEETRGQVERLEKVFRNLNESPQGEKCDAMEGLVREAEEIISRDADEDVRDAGLIASAQRIEHYEIAAYGTVATYAEMLERSDDHKLLSKTLSEEKDADQKLNKIAMQVVNPEAVAA